MNESIDKSLGLEFKWKSRIFLHLDWSWIKMMIDFLFVGEKTHSLFRTKHMIVIFGADYT